MSLPSRPPAAAPAPPEPQLWLTRYGDELYRYALARVPDAGSAEELVQDTLLSALDGLAAFRAEASERTWLFVILKRKLIDYYRRRSRRAEVSLDALAPAGPDEAVFFEANNGHWRREQHPSSWADRADGPLEQQELQQVLRLCQQKLPPQHEAVFALRFIEELSAEEICQELGLSAANYWVIVHRAKLQLRRCLEKNGLGRAASA
ncbi:sigma-70 family RNA polymerase sigma factor [Hymenobacter chitinivorans]|uniref:sigma-70 family RNA polymerase sigma factor n=1 Tax=Hymenobacter chitinivorans TaxID=89969 RepID=UPI0012FDF33E|nr:sigma-70 family RNA polymerase sigma factor [Hymenobacter chitinivorans]